MRLILMLLEPFILLTTLLRRGSRETAARLGRGLPHLPGCLWIHAASMGEVNAVRPLVDALVAQGKTVLLTTMTTTGLTQAGKIPGVSAHLVPFDLPLIVSKAFKRVQPAMLLLVETELWPELLYQARRMRVPVVSVNGRLSERSLRRYRRFAAIWRPLLWAVTAVGAQSPADAARFLALGQSHVTDTGNLKFCVSFPSYDRAALHQAWGLAEHDFVVVVGSSRPGEEALMRGLLPRMGRSLERPTAASPGDCRRLRVILTPRHLQRLAEVERALEGCEWSRRSEGKDTQVILVDEMGVLAQAYALADLALVGGSFYPGFGGHNPVEPAYFGVPTVMGPHHTSCADSVRILQEGGGLLVASAAELGNVLERLLTDDALRTEMGHKAQATVQANATSLQKTLELVEKILDERARVW